MGVTVITGRCGSGKSRRLMDRIRELIADPFAKIIVVVPGQLTFETEKKIMKSCGVEGIFGLQVMSMQRLAMKLIEDTGAVSFITNSQKAVIVSRALSESNFGEGIRDLESCAAQLLGRLKSYGHTPESLRRSAKNIKDKALAKKINDTAFLYEKYMELCAGMPDVSDMYTLAAQRAAKSDLLKDAYLFIDGLDSASPAVMSFLTEAMRLCKETFVSFRSGDAEEGDLFSSEYKDMERLIEAAGRSGNGVTVTEAEEPPRYETPELEFLNSNLYRYPYKPYEGEVKNIMLAEADSVEKEVGILAGNILREVKAGLRFRDISVVCGGVEGYLPAIKSKFAEYGIPYFCDERRSLSDNTLFEFLYSALSAAAGDLTGVEGYIYGFYSVLSFEEKCELKKYADKYSLSGWHYILPFRRMGSERAEELRKKAAAPLAALTRGILLDTAENQIEAVIRFIEACGVKEKTESFCEQLRGKETLAEYGYFSQVYEKTAEALEGVCEVYSGRRIDPAGFCEIIKTCLSASKIALIPPSTDEAGIFDISVARLPDTKVLFAIGVHDGMWPAGDSPGIISGAEKEALYGVGVDLGVFDLSSEKLKVYSVLVKPQKRLYISWNSTCRPAMVIDRIKRLFPGIQVQKDQAYISSAGAQTALLGELSTQLGRAPENTDIEKTLAACAYYLKTPGWREKTAAMLLRTNAAVPLECTCASQLYGGLRCSSTRIEGYYKCPLRHFLDFGAGLREERDYTDDKADTGSFMHLALELFAKKLIEEEKDIKALSAVETEKRMADAAGLAAEAHDGGKLFSDERFILKYGLLRKELINAALRIREHFLGSQACIYSTEQSFSDYTVSTSFGDVTLSGKIDRIDEGGGYFRVVDYKSSAESFSLKEFLGGVALQLPVYVAAAERILKKQGKTLSPAGGYYMKIGDSYGGTTGEVAKNSRMQGISIEDADALLVMSGAGEDGSFRAIDQSLTKSGALSGSGRKKYFKADELKKVLGYAGELIKTAAERIYGGDTSISPAKGINGGDACTYCGYGSVCMMDCGYEGNRPRELAPGDKSLFTCGEEAENDEQ